MVRHRSASGPRAAEPISDHFDGQRFCNPGIRPPDKSLWDILRWRRTSRPARWPARVAVSPVLPPARVEGARVTVIGHATVLVQIAGLNIVTDPHWSHRASPFGFAGPRRVAAPGVAFANLPTVDAVLLSHNHYDHLDMATLRDLVERDGPLILTPLGNDTIINAAIPRARVHAGDWWHRLRLSDDVDVTVVPALHWSARGLRDRRKALWGGFAIRGAGQLIYFAGDTAYGDGSIFREIRRQLGPPDVALLPIGAYSPRWFMEPVHADPEEAVAIMQDLGAAAAIGIHWGVFQLSDEGRDDPKAALASALTKARLMPEQFVAAEPGHAWQASPDACLGSLKCP